MNRKVLLQFLDEYQDGNIDEAAAKALAEQIREGGEEADYILDELAMTGYISQALQKDDADQFVRTFLERLYAEKAGRQPAGSGQGAGDMVRRTPQEQPAPRRRGRFSLRGLLPGTAAGETEGQPEHGGGHPRLSLKLLGTLGLTLLVAVVTVIALMKMPGAFSSAPAILLEASPGSLVVNQLEQRELRPNMKLRWQDQVTVPVGGRARILIRHLGEVELGSDSLATLPADAASLARLLLTRGECRADFDPAPDGRDYLIATPHAGVRPLPTAEFALVVSPASSHLTVINGNAVFVRNFDGRAIRVGQGQFAVATRSDEFEARGDNHETHETHEKGDGDWGDDD